MLPQRTRGIYILGNDKVFEHVCALVNSIRLHDAEMPICLIPYNDDHARSAEFVRSTNGFLFDDATPLRYADDWCSRIFAERRSLPGFRPNNLRKIAGWFGPFERFIMMDADILVFDRIADTMDLLDDYDLLCYDRMYKGNGLRYVFGEKARAHFPEERLAHIFNGGFWISKNGLFTQERLTTLFEEILDQKDILDPNQPDDQPILNYIGLSLIPRLGNITEITDWCPVTWAGAAVDADIHEQVPFKDGKPMRYVHWAGIQINEQAPLWEVWRHYRSIDAR